MIRSPSALYVKKPIPTMAYQWLGFSQFCEEEKPDVTRYDFKGLDKCRHCDDFLVNHGWIETLEGGHIVCKGDWILKGVEGEKWPVKNSIFLKTYEQVG